MRGRGGGPGCESPLCRGWGTRWDGRGVGEGAVGRAWPPQRATRQEPGPAPPGRTSGLSVAGAPRARPRLRQRGEALCACRRLPAHGGLQHPEVGGQPAEQQEQAKEQAGGGPPLRGERERCAGGRGGGPGAGPGRGSRDAAAALSRPQSQPAESNGNGTPGSRRRRGPLWD